MNIWPSQSQNALKAFYGDPDTNADGLPDADFESKYLTFIAPGYPMFLAWNMQPITRIKVNKRCAESLQSILIEIGRNFTLAERQKYQIDRFGGCYNFRTMRGLSALSVHSYGAAIDLAPELNPLGAEYGSKPNMIPLKAVSIFESYGWAWGGRWHRPDAQHFQAASV